MQVDSRWNGLLQLRQLGANTIDRIDNIGFRQLADHQQDGRFGVGHPGVAHVLHRVADRRHVAEPHRRAVVVVHDQRLVFGGFFQLIVGLYLPAMGAIVDRPLWFTHVGVADGRAHRIQRDALVKQRLRVQVNAHRGQRAAADVYVTHAVNLRDTLRQLGGGEIVQFALRIGVWGQRQDHDRRIGRVGFAIGWTTGHPAWQQVLRGVNRCLHVARRAVDITIEVKFENDTRTAQRAAGGHLIDTRNAP